MRRLLVATLVTATLAASSAWATTIHVPGDQPTIQAGIDAASAGDTVLVASGIYTGAGNRDLDPGGRNLVILSEEGSAATVIDCQGSDADPHRGFFVVGAGSTALTIGGFTVRNGYASEKGGGIYCESTVLTLVDCVIEDCDAGSSWSDWDGHGGGMYSISCALAVDSSAFLSCQSGCPDGSGSSGGGVAAVNCSGWFNDCEFDGNSTGAAGGGLAGSNLTLTSCLFVGNHAGDFVVGDGGGLCGNVTLEDVEFRYNYVDANGGGMCGSGVLERVLFHNNSAGRNGGGLDGGGTVTDAIFIGNEAGYVGGGARSRFGGVFERVAFIDNWGWEDGGGVSCGGTSEFRNCTFAGNCSQWGGTAIGCGGTPVFDRVIIADGQWSAGSVHCGGSCYPEFECSNIFGNEGGDWLGCIADQFGINGNFSADPMFCDPDDDNFMLDVTSPCAPDNNSCGVLIGAYPVGCGASPVEATSWSRVKAMYR
jgi:predicted outer membrane repeat protein